MTCFGSFEFESNQVTTEIIDIEITKSTCQFVLSGKDICYTIIATNYSDIDFNNLLFSDELDSNVTYVPNTFLVNGDQKTPMMADNTIQYLINIPSGDSVEMKFCVRVN